MVNPISFHSDVYIVQLLVTYPNPPAPHRVGEHRYLFLHNYYSTLLIIYLIISQLLTTKLAALG